MISSIYPIYPSDRPCKVLSFSWMKKWRFTAGKSFHSQDPNPDLCGSNSMLLLSSEARQAHK